MRSVLIQFLRRFLIGLALTGSMAAGADTAPVLFGKDGWLFTPYEFALTSDAADTAATIQMLQRANKLFAEKGIAVALVIVPSKIRIHADKLPDEKPLDAYTSEKYVKAVAALREGGMHVISLNEEFLASQHRSSETPLFLRYDTHWSPTGAMVAAEAIAKQIGQDSYLSAALAKTRVDKYSLAMAPKKTVTRARDLVRLLPAGAPVFPPELVQTFKVTKESDGQSSLLGDGESVDITVIGSSYTNKNTLYPDALRYTLQRNVLDISLPVDQGPWFGMVSYLGDDAFKTRKPKLIIWEIPERELRSPPNYGARDPRYVMNNEDWLSKMTTLLR